MALAVNTESYVGEELDDLLWRELEGVRARMIAWLALDTVENQQVYCATVWKVRVSLASPQSIILIGHDADKHECIEGAAGG